MAKQKTLHSKIFCAGRLSPAEHNAHQYGFRIPKEDMDWFKKHVEGNMNFVIATILRDFKKRASIHIAQSKPTEHIIIRDLDDDFDYFKVL